MTTDASGPLTGVGVVLGAPDGSVPPYGVLDRAALASSAAEAAGLGSLWVGETTADPPDRVAYEAYSLLGALGRLTGRLHLGVVADGALRRAPSMLAKIVTGVDVVSHGRAVFGLDGDIDRPDDADRLAEALEVGRAVLEDEHPRVDGQIYHVEDAVNRPSPVQPGGVPLVVFLAGPGPGLPALAAVCARWADAVVVGGGPAGVDGTLELLDGADGPRLRPGARPLVLGRVPAASSPSDAVGRVRAAGADGCLVEVPAPWPADVVGGLASAW